MGYLKCEKCGGYYELQDGESPEDFESCECGGTLKHTENVDNIKSQLKETPITLTCPLCGTENPEIAEFCASCGNNLSKENEKTFLRDEKVSNLQKKYNKPKSPRAWYKNKLTIAVILVVLILLFIGVYFANIMSNNSHSNYNINVTGNVASSNSNSATTSSSSPKEGSETDYNQGYDSGYLSGVNEAYSDWPYADEVSKSLKVSETWRQGYKDGYKQGYNDIKNDRSLEKPRTPGTAILDPRTGEKIYS